MLLKNVLSILKENSVRLGLEGDQLKIRAAKGALTPEIKQLLVDLGFQTASSKLTLYPIKETISSMDHFHFDVGYS